MLSSTGEMARGQGLHGTGVDSCRGRGVGVVRMSMLEKGREGRHQDSP